MCRVLMRGQSDHWKPTRETAAAWFSLLARRQTSKQQMSCFFEMAKAFFPVPLAGAVDLLKDQKNPNAPDIVAEEHPMPSLFLVVVEILSSMLLVLTATWRLTVHVPGSQPAPAFVDFYLSEIKHFLPLRSHSVKAWESHSSRQLHPPGTIGREITRAGLLSCSNLKGTLPDSEREQDHSSCRAANHDYPSTGH